MHACTLAQALSRTLSPLYAKKSASPIALPNIYIGSGAGSDPLHKPLRTPNAKLVSISSSRADRSYTFSLYFAHREQVQNCTLLIASEHRRSCKGAPQHCTLLTASKCKLHPKEHQHTAASCEEAHRVLTHQSSGELSVSAKRWQSHDSNAEPVRTTRVIAAPWPASYSIRAATIV